MGMTGVVAARVHPARAVRLLAALGLTLAIAQPVVAAEVVRGPDEVRLRAAVREMPQESGLRLLMQVFLTRVDAVRVVALGCGSAAAGPGRSPEAMRVALRDTLAELRATLAAVDPALPDAAQLRGRLGVLVTEAEATLASTDAGWLASPDAATRAIGVVRGLRAVERDLPLMTLPLAGADPASLLVLAQAFEQERAKERRHLEACLSESG